MLDGRPALIVEAEFLIALDIQRMLELLGVGQTLFARNAAEARELRNHWPTLALAVVALEFDDHEARQLPDDLLAAAIPVILTTGDVVQHQAMASGQRQVVIKPIQEQTMASAVKRALAISD